MGDEDDDDDDDDEDDDDNDLRQEAPRKNWRVG